MSKLVKFFAIAALIGGALAMTPAPANAQHHHGGFGHFMAVAFRGGWGGGWGWGPGPFWGWGYGYPYYAGRAGLRLCARLAPAPLDPGAQLALLVIGQT